MPRARRKKTPEPRAVEAPLLDGNPDQMLSIDEVGKLLRVSGWMVRKIIRYRQLAAVDVGGMTRIRVRDLNAFIQGHRIADDEPPISATA
jgi:excisionase family DNA binding protein